MPLARPIHPGRIDWTGENPGILLKERPDGPWSTLALFFRIFWSPAGRGTVLLLYEKPDQAVTLPDACNVVISDNEPLARFLMDGFVARLGGAFGGSPAFQAVRYLPMTAGGPSGDPRSSYRETVRSDDIEVELVWSELGTPTALELPRALTGTKAHEMFSLLVESRDARILLNGRRLPGVPVPREQAGVQTTTAFLYFSETWIWPQSE
jgi:hypothetical protein